MTAEASSVDNLRGRVLQGIAWKAASQICLQLSRIVVTVILARLLTPHDYGLAAMVIVFSGLVFVFSDLSLGAALIQRRILSEVDRSTVFWTSLVCGAAFTLGGAALSAPIAEFYGEPAVRPLFIAVSVSFFITALGTTQTALLIREMSFRSLELRRMAGALAGAIVGIAAAALGYGAWAIIGQQLAIAVVSTTLVWVVSPWRPMLTYSVASLRSLGAFSGKVFGARVLFYLNGHMDNLLIGRFLGAAPLGAYALAYNVMLTPIHRIAGPVQEVLYPAFSRLQSEPRRMGDAWFRVTRLVASIALPALLGLIVVAPEFVEIVLGERWTPATPVVQILAGVGLLYSVQRLNSSILQARDRAGTLLRYSLLSSACHLAAFIIGLRWGIVGVAACFAAVNTFLQPYFAWLTARSLGLSVIDVARNLAGVAQAALVMVACVFAVRLALLQIGVPSGAVLAASIATGVTVYWAACSWRAPEILADLRSLGRRARGGPAALGPQPS